MTAAKDEAIRAAADRLIEAFATGEPTDPIRDSVPDMTLDDAYEVQVLVEQALVKTRGAVVGRKIGLTSKAMQEQLGVDSPDFGFLTEDMMHYGDSTVLAENFISPKVEPEFAFKLNKRLAGPGVTREDAVAAIESVHPAIEIIDSRVRDWNIRLVDTVSDNASCGAVVIGSEPLDVDPNNLMPVACSIVIDGKQIASGTGADVLDDPIAPMVWLANILGERGVAMNAGDIVIPGSFTAAQVVESGSTATADFGELGSISVTF
ncbi:2-keto-4-pentenoate hydratase [Propioniferax innocua]|uniref:2-keto-4-pentenoate hydratase n=1 Tax=Propioniferax innocua TaxID=1753 RepID=A0A542ZDB5_9ACTN|nr:2-oxopent-4-enoate hydratase [Propioniferax innocua]TQL58332.1 2-keto-4-pentenoate hydratase [Propioniferax innocua]